MPFKPNYRFARFERERLKKAKKDEKLRRQQQQAPVGEDDNPTATDQAEAAVPPRTPSSLDRP